MKAISRAIDRFCYRHPRFGIPHLIRLVVFGTVLVYIFGMMDTTNTLYSLLSFSPVDIMRGQVWRLITFVFIPIQGHPLWLFIALYFSFFLGTTLEQTWGTARFTIYYLLSIVLYAGLGMILHFVAPFPGFVPLFVSGYYIHLFLVMAFATLYADAPFRPFFVFPPIPVKWIGIFSFGLFLYNLFQFRYLFPANLTPLVLLLPYLLFCGNALFRAFGASGGKTTKAQVNFKRKVKQVEQDQRSRSYSRKCEVCGKTDVDYPDMEFRYCSRCDGYHCYCMDHINNHEHVV